MAGGDYSTESVHQLHRTLLCESEIRFVWSTADVVMMVYRLYLCCLPLTWCTWSTDIFYTTHLSHFRINKGYKKKKKKRKLDALSSSTSLCSKPFAPSPRPPPLPLLSPLSSLAMAIALRSISLSIPRNSSPPRRGGARSVSPFFRRPRPPPFLLRASWAPSHANGSVGSRRDADPVEVIGIGSRKDAVIDFCSSSRSVSSSLLRFW